MIENSQGTLTLQQRVVAAMLQQDRATAPMGVRLVCVGTTDTAFGIACNTHNLRTVAASGQIDYLRPGLKGDVLLATAMERAVGRRLGLYDVALTNQHGETVALFRGKSCRVDGTVVPEDQPTPDDVLQIAW